jgi:hypothetical protein
MKLPVSLTWALLHWPADPRPPDEEHHIPTPVDGFCPKCGELIGEDRTLCEACRHAVNEGEVT